MNTDDHDDEFDFKNPDELAELEKRWRSGQLHAQVERVLRFFALRRDEIVQMAGGRQDATALRHATKSLIRESGSIDQAAEVQEELREINNEIWYQGEKGNYDREGIVCNWATEHAPNWRRWTIKQYLFVVDRSVAEIAAHLTASQADRYAAVGCCRL